MKFVVTGLPRSRTKWASAFLSTPECPVLHDLGMRGDFAISDPLILLTWKDIPEDVPIAYIDRPLPEVHESLKDFNVPLTDLLDLAVHAKEMITTREVLVLDFHNLDARKLWQHCHGTEISDEYLMVYMDMNIRQQKVEDIRRVA